ncbi:MAG: response regulator [Candidatus Omnitrophota bacterium]
MKKILIVDDEEDLLMLLEQRLLANGYSVIKATGGVEAIKLAKEKQPDLVLLDIWMPGVGGVEVAEALKANQETKNIPIVFLTCLYTREDERSKGHIIQGQYFIAKPYDPQELLSEIKGRIGV